jgi:hypothetical protein
VEKLLGALPVVAVSPRGGESGCQAARPDEAGADPGSPGQRPQAAGTGNEDVITADSQAHHEGIDHITAGKQHSRPAAMVQHDCRDTARLPVARPPRALARDRDQADQRLHEPA